MQVIQSGLVVATLGTNFTGGDEYIEIVALCDGLGFKFIGTTVEVMLMRLALRY